MHYMAYTIDKICITLALQPSNTSGVIVRTLRYGLGMPYFSVNGGVWGGVRHK